MQNWSKEFTGSLAEIAATDQWVDQLARQLKLPSDKVYALRVCAEELLTNIFTHSGSASPRIKVTISLFPERIEFVVEDNGKPFDVAAAIPHRVDEPIENAKPGGLGIQLIRSFADRLSYARAGLGNRVVAEIALSPKAAVG